MSTSASGLKRGLVVGLCATQALDWVGILMYDGEDKATRAAEDRARGYHHVYEVAVRRLAARAGRVLSEEQTSTWGWRFHKAAGILAGVGYLRLRRAFPGLGWGCGLAFGTVFFLLADEVMAPALGLSPGPRAFSWKVHARGAASHLAYGIAAETTARLLDRSPVAASTPALTDGGAAA